MKAISCRMPVKIAAFFLLSVSLAFCVLGGFGISLLAEAGYYDADPPSFYDSTFCETVTEEYANEVFNTYMAFSQTDTDASSQFQIGQLKKKFSSENTNFFFILQNGSGNILFSNYDDRLEYGSNISYHMDYDSVSYSNHSNNLLLSSAVIHCFVRDPISANDDYAEALHLFNLLFSVRYTLIVLTVLQLPLILFGLTLLLCGAGYTPHQDAAVLSGFHRIPFDLYVLLLAIPVVLCFGMFFSIYDRFFCDGISYQSLPFSYVSLVLWIFLGLLVIAMCVDALLATIVVRVRVGNFWNNTVLAHLLRLICRLLREIGRGFRSVFRNLPIVWKPVLGFLAFVLLGMLFTVWFRYSWSIIALLCWILLYVAAFVLVLRLAVQLSQLKKGGEKLAQGDLDYKTDTRHMFWEFKKHGENLNRISLGMARAVEEQIKSERLKAELITNVSHDIKTPLTSIINYVDLLQKEDLGNETAQEYVRVLNRQAIQLKKLTEDLVEASKASTGNIAVHPARTNVVELLGQSVGEYEERFEKAHLTPIITATAPDIPILADGRLLWRVFDNLLGNIIKYSQADTRVYLSVTERDNVVSVVFKNISRDSLNIPTDELMERFVRGDSARTSEGSGLGLSIAQSLTELQGGRFALAIDGDLFKAIVSFDRLLISPDT